MADILERLRLKEANGSASLEELTALDEIERLRAELKRLNTECDDLTEIAYPATG